MEGGGGPEADGKTIGEFRDFEEISRISRNFPGKLPGGAAAAYAQREPHEEAPKTERKGKERETIMKKITALLLAMLLAMTSALALAENAAAEQPEGEALEETVRDADWTIPETTEMTEEVKALFEKAMEGLLGVDYEPLGALAEKEGTWCILCRATVVYPGAKPYYALVYVNESGVQNIYDLWLGAHAEPAAE